MTLYRCTVPGCGITATKRLRRPPQCPRDCCNLVPVSDEEVSGPTLDCIPDGMGGERGSEDTPAVRAPGLRVWIETCQFEVTEPTILGRNGDIGPERFREDLSTARQHAELYYAHGQWWVRNLCSSGSPCVFNGREIALGEAAVVGSSGDLLLGTRGFVVHLTPPAVDAQTAARGALEDFLDNNDELGDRYEHP